MGMLTGAEIESRLVQGTIKIQDYDPAHLNPNSYNLSLSPRLMVYRPRHWYTPWRKPLVWGEKNPPDEIIMMGEEGYVTRPGWFYLGSTVEYTETHDTVPVIDGRSSTGRMSLHIHATAGFGDIGFEGVWTLELYSIIPVRIFPYARIAQISYQTTEGQVRDKYQGRYHGFREAVCSQEERSDTRQQESVLQSLRGIEDARLFNHHKKEG